MFRYLALVLSLLVAPAIATAEEQDPALALVKERRVVGMLQIQAQVSILKFAENKALLCATGKGRYAEFMTPALGAALATRSDEYDRLMAAQLKSRLEDYELRSVLDKQGRSPFARSYNDALSESIRALGPQTARMGTEIAQAALTAALAKAKDESLVVEGAPCRE